MFKFLSELFENETAIKQSHSKTTDVDIEKQIYQTVTTANNYLLFVEKSRNEELMQINISKPTIDQSLIDKLVILEKTGFVNQPEVKNMRLQVDKYQKDLADYQSKLRDNKAKLNRLEYFQRKYPNYKFIDDSILEDLNKKFGLITAPVEYYISDIPDKNKQEIVDFRCGWEDKRYLFKINLYNVSRSSAIRCFPDEDLSSLKSYNYGDFFIEKYLSFPDLDSLKRNLKIYLSDCSINPVNEYTSRCYMHKELQPLTDALIIAPPSKFDIPKDYITKKGLVTKSIKFELRDPVVLQPVIGGYLIVSHWGFESTLPEIAGEPNVGIHNSMN